MNLIISLIIGMLFSAALYLLLQRSFFKLILGIIVFGYATIFFLFVVGGVTRDAPPLFSGNNPVDEAAMADPLPQALTLTAIVIGIGVQLFAMILLKRAHDATHSSDLDELRNTDQLD